MQLILDVSLAVLIILLHAYWIYKLSTYDWTKFEEDSEHDDFFKAIRQ